MKKIYKMTEEHRRKISESLKGYIKTKEHRDKLSMANINKKQSQETIMKRVKKLIGKKRSQEIRDKLSQRRKGMKFSEEHRNNLVLSHLGIKQSKESIEKRILNNIGKKRTTQQIENIRKGISKAMKSSEVRKRMSESRKRLFRENKIHLPVKDTSIEIKIQSFLKELGITFFTHQYIKEIKHGYQCDILIPSMNLVIECDGDYWHKYPTGKDIDHIRTSELIEKGFKVLRLWEREIRILSLEEFKDKLGGN